MDQALSCEFTPVDFARHVNEMGSASIHVTLEQLVSEIQAGKAALGKPFLNENCGNKINCWAQGGVYLSAKSSKKYFIKSFGGRQFMDKRLASSDGRPCRDAIGYPCPCSTAS